MPNSRRRKFSVKNNNPRRGAPKGATSATTSNVTSQSPTKLHNNRSKLFPYTSMAIEPMEKVEECNENSSISLEKTNSKHVIVCSNQVASSSKSLDSHSTATAISESVESSHQPNHELHFQTSKDTKEKYRPKQHQHRARIRSPKTNIVIKETTKKESKEIVDTTGIGLHLLTAESHIDTVGTNTEITQATPVYNTNVVSDLQIRSLDNMCRVCHGVDLTNLIRPSACTYQEPDLKNHLPTREAIHIEASKDARKSDGKENNSETVATNTDLPQTPDYNAKICLEMDRSSDHSLDDMCRICHGGDMTELGSLISACSCRGTVGRVHVRCLERWLTESGKSRCELCGVRYTTRRVHRYGVLRALIMWFVSQNAKQLMVDSLGIMLMSPLAVLAAWLSGRTLAGLMTQETQVTPWPLASTFVLACMTLVCYYCWIVSAATRHALGWWIWYRSQYEVRLQVQEYE